jgi:hypothetical protein
MGILSIRFDGEQMWVSRKVEKSCQKLQAVHPFVIESPEKASVMYQTRLGFVFYDVML